MAFSRHPSQTLFEAQPADEVNAVSPEVFVQRYSDDTLSFYASIDPGIPAAASGTIDLEGRLSSDHAWAVIASIDFTFFTSTNFRARVEANIRAPHRVRAALRGNGSVSPDHTVTVRISE